MSGTLLILGAGFNVDAAREAGINEYRYPLVGDLVRACFGLRELPNGQSVEDLFADAIARKDGSPVKRMCSLLMEADYHISTKLRLDLGTADNIYTTCLRHFAPRAIVTFNYDSLAELLLFGMQLWRPEDGYGIRVRASLERVVHPPPIAERSSTVILHQHGTLCLYASEYTIRHDERMRMGMIEAKAEPDFIFDPDSISLCFSPFERILPTYGYEYIESRIIAPVPRKAGARQAVFVQRMSIKAQEMLREADRIIVVGYRFNPTDAESYDGLLRASVGKTITLVLPEAKELSGRLAKSHPRISWSPVPLPFRAWAERGYPHS